MVTLCMVRLSKQGFLACALACTFHNVAAAEASVAPTLSSNVRAGGIDSSQSKQSGGRIHRGRAVGLVDAPVDRVVQVIEDYANYQRFMPNFEISRVLSRRGAAALLFVQVKALHGLTKFRAEVKLRAHKTPEAHVVEAHMTRGNLRQFDATWHVTQVSGAQTLVAFELCADPDLPLNVGKGLISDQNEKEARKSIGALREYISARASNGAARIRR